MSPVTNRATDAIAGRSRIGNRPNVSDGSPKTPSAVGTMTLQYIGPDPGGMPRLGRIRRPGDGTTVSGIERRKIRLTATRTMCTMYGRTSGAGPH